MHFCHICTGMNGGPQVIVAQLANAQRRAGHRVSVVYTPTRDSEEKFAHLFEPATQFIPWTVAREVGLSSDFRAHRDLYRILKTMSPDIVHLHNAKAGAHGRLLCKRLGLPNVYSPHGLAFLQNNLGLTRRGFYFALEWFAGLFGDLLVASSQGEYDVLRSVPCSKALINNGVDIDVIEALAGDGKSAPRTGRFRIVVVGRIETQKNPELVAELAESSPADWEWIWVGEGTLLSVLNRSARIDALGWLPRADLLATVRSADVFLQASRLEGMSFGLMEAMALGRPCVVSNVPGNRDLVAHEVAGYVCSTPSQYQAALGRLAANPALREELGANARGLIEHTFNLDIAIANWAETYRKLLGALPSDERLMGLSEK